MAKAIQDERNRKQPPDLEYLFHPQSIAIVGVSTEPEKAHIGGNVFLRALIEFGYKGNIFPINPKAKEVLGLKAYPSLESVPQGVDYVICSLPAHLTPQLMKDCAAKGVKVVSMYTAGFSEAGEEGRKLEQELADIARQGGTRLIGPNCLGIYCPSTGLTITYDLSKEAGSVGLLCQSGGHSTELATMGGFRGIRFSKVISYGNAADLNEADFLEYFTKDNETKIIAAYIEGVKQGRRFLKVLRQAANKKPVILFKGGRSEAGNKAVASHTGVLAGNNEMWAVLCRQAGVIQVHSPEEMLDVLMAFLYLKPPKGQRVGIVGIGGGASVQAADECESAGLIVPTLPYEVRQELRNFTPEAGTSVHNPVDSSPGVFWTASQFRDTVRIVADYEGIDFLFIQRSIGIRIFHERDEGKTWDSIIAAGREIEKPVAMVLRNLDTPIGSRLFFELQRDCLEAGLPVYPTIGRAARAISKLIQYHDDRREEESV